MNHGEIVSFLWGVADLIRDTFKRGKYQDVILPLTVLRRLDCVLARTKEKVLGKQAELRGRKLENLDPQLRKASGFAFYNTSRYDFDKLLGDAPHLAANLRNYIAGFSQNMPLSEPEFVQEQTLPVGQLADDARRILPGSARTHRDGLEVLRVHTAQTVDDVQHVVAATFLAVGDDVDSRAILIPDGLECSPVEQPRELGLPDLFPATIKCEAEAVQQRSAAARVDVTGLGVAADERGENLARDRQRHGFLRAGLARHECRPAPASD